VGSIKIQIYEVQTPGEAEALLELGVDRIGSVLLSADSGDGLAETLTTVSRLGGESSLIPLFLDPDLISRALDRYQPHIVHFCEMLWGANGGDTGREAALMRQRIIRERFPQIKVMRSIPIAPSGKGGLVPSLELARMFEPVSDIFLTDTLMVAGQNPDGEQPVEGFVGITGKTCDWEVAARLVRESRIPVILAGGISPENVAEGIFQVRPSGVDSCTLTNAVDKTGKPIRFQKDLDKVRRLVAQTRRAENYTLKTEGATQYV